MLDRRINDIPTMAKLDAILDRLDRIEAAFPGGIEHHRATHEQLEIEQKAAREFVRDLKLTLMKNGIIATLLFVLSAAILGFAAKWTTFIKGL